MLWGTGTLRSGTLSLASMVAGRHEPGEYELWPFHWLATRSPQDDDAGDNFGFFHARRIVLKYLMEGLNVGAPVIDARVGMVLPWVRKVDPQYHLIVVYRDPVATARSWNRFRFLTDADPYRNHHAGANEMTWGARAAAWWNDSYRTILNEAGPNVEYVRCEELPVHEHGFALSGGTVEPLTKAQEAFIQEATKEVFNALEIARQRHPRRAWRELMTEVR